MLGSFVTGGDPVGNWTTLSVAPMVGLEVGLDVRIVVLVTIMVDSTVGEFVVIVAVGTFITGAAVGVETSSCVCDGVDSSLESLFLSDSDSDSLVLPELDLSLLDLASFLLELESLLFLLDLLLFDSESLESPLLPLLLLLDLLDLLLFDDLLSFDDDFLR